jgi:hypothetical protein
MKERKRKERRGVKGRRNKGGKGRWGERKGKEEPPQAQIKQL